MRSEPLSPALRLSGTVALAALVLTVLVGTLPFLGFAYEAPALHVALETANSLIALLVGLLVYGRLRRNHALAELLLVCSLAVVAVANLLLTAIPAAIELADEPEASKWAPLVVRLVATLLLVAAALVPATRRVRNQRMVPVVLALALLVAFLAVAALLLGDELPPPVSAEDVPGSSAQPVITGHPVALAVQALSGLLYLVAAVAFTRRASRTGDELLRWVGAACVLAVFARVNYLLFPSLYSDYVYVGDFFRFGYYVLLLTGAVREISGYWAAQAQAAVLEERRRMARDLHDGLTQELSYIWAQSQHLVRHPDDGRAVERINGAAGRALDEARGAIAALTQALDRGFTGVLRETVEGLASRYDVRAVVHVDDDVTATPEQADAVLRIVSEAFRNAVVHGRASQVEVHVQAPLMVTVHDDGQGFEPATAKSGGFGLTSMRERAEGVGARFAIGSGRGKGTTVTVAFS